MKKPNKLYRKLGGRRSTAGAAFATVCRPARSLRSMFGFDLLGRDAAEGIEVSLTGFRKVSQILKGWGDFCRVPKLSTVFRMLNTRPLKSHIPSPKPEMD
jgi:hypothetical protein